MRRFLDRVLHLVRLRRPDRDLAREIDAHLALLQEAHEARGLAPDAARRAARLAFGSADAATEQHRDARSFHWIEDAWRDAAIGLRLLRKSSVFTVTAVLSLAIGIGANTAIFSVANAMLFRPPEEIREPSRLITLGTARGDGGVNPLPYATYLELAGRTSTLSTPFAEALFANVVGVAAASGSDAQPALGHRVSESFFRALGVDAARGRVFARGDQTGAVLAHDYWIRRFHGDDRVVGQLLRINGQPVMVVGVAEPAFHGTGLQRCDLWLVIGSEGTARLNVVAGGRLRADVSLAAAAAEIRALGETIARDQLAAEDRTRRLSALPFSRAGSNRNVVIGFTAAMMGLVSLVLFAACANVGGILLTRSTARAREVSLRAALGASRGRLVRQLLTETLVLFLLAGFAGVALAWALVRSAAPVLAALPTPVTLPLTLDWRVLLFASALSLAVACVFGILPAWRGSAVDAAGGLRDGVRSSAGRGRLRSGFVAAQIACSVLLVVLGITFVRVLRHSGAADPGFEARHVDVAAIDRSVLGETAPDGTTFWQTLLDRVRQAPAVESASLARVPPGGWEGIGLGSVAPADRAATMEAITPGWNIVEVGYFGTLRVPLLAGRDFSARDAAGALPAAILSETIAQRFWPGQQAVGKPLRLAVYSTRLGRVEERLATVIGVVGDIRSSSLIDGLAEPYVYLPLAQSEGLGMLGQMSIVTRRRGDASLVPVIAQVARDLDRRLVLTSARSLDDSIALGLIPQHAFATISGAMALVTLLLASMGIYGVTAYAVALRRREFAIRLALGAPRGRVLQMVLRQGSALVAVGLTVGLVLAVGVGQALSVLFYGLPATHGPTMAGTVLIFAAIGLAASIIPARGAVRDGWRRALQED